MMRSIVTAVVVVLAGPALADDAEDLRQRLEALETRLTDEEAARLAAAAAAAEDLRQRIAALAATLTDEEAARLAEAAAAEALRERLRNADAELTAMTLALEEQRRLAEDTLTLLAVAQAAQSNLTERLAVALVERSEAREALQAALAYETGRFQMQVSGDGGEGIEAWVLDTKTGAVRMCESRRAGQAECSGWNWSDPDNPGAD